MIRRIREMAENMGEDMAPASHGAHAEEEFVSEDPELDVLVKHAMNGTHWLEHDPKQVWQRLSQRVRGPFGSMAIEEPANIGSAMPLPQDYETNEAYDSPSGGRRHIGRLNDLPFPAR